MAIDYTNKEDLELYVENNIRLINQRISEFKLANAPDAIFDETDIKNYLKKKLFRELNTIKSDLLLKLEENQFTKSKVIDIANEFILYKSDLQTVFEMIILEELRTQCDDTIGNSIAEHILEMSDFSNKKSRFIKTTLNKILTKTTYLALMNGFSTNINNIESGIMTANAGDSVQFLFVSRAILAGYNCSNVDVRSSRYDAIIDYNGKLYKIQIKGISGDTISLKDRNRGGRGIDTQNSRNQGQRITSNDCDIYVAVDKQIGICYIIPMSFIDSIPMSETSVNLLQLSEFKENWKVIDSLE